MDGRKGVRNREVEVLADVRYEFLSCVHRNGSSVLSRREGTEVGRYCTNRSDGAGKQAEECRRQQ